MLNESMRVWMNLKYIKYIFIIVVFTLHFSLNGSTSVTHSYVPFFIQPNLKIQKNSIHRHYSLPRITLFDKEIQNIGIKPIKNPRQVHIRLNDNIRYNKRPIVFSSLLSKRTVTNELINSSREESYKKDNLKRYSSSPESTEGEKDDNTTASSGGLLKQQQVWEKSDYILLSILSSMGTMETAFLTYTKLYGSLETLCSTSTSSGNPFSLTCGDVLTSHWASIMGIPLPALGLVAYSFTFLVSMSKILNWGKKSIYQIPESDTINDSSLSFSSSKKTQELPILLITSSIMAIFSTYLMGLLIFDLKTACPYCLASASLTYAMAYLSWKKELKIDRLSALIFGGTSIAVGSLLSGLIFLYANLEEINSFLDDSSNIKSLYPSSIVNKSKQDDKKASNKVLYLPPDITTTSTEQAFRVGEKLKNLNSKMFGAYWCSHCYDQKQAFGKEAYEKYIQYIECASDGADNQVGFCKESKVPGYPTWQINGKLYPGQKTLDELETLLKDLDGNSKLP